MPKLPIDKLKQKIIKENRAQSLLKPGSRKLKFMFENNATRSRKERIEIKTTQDASHSLI